MFKQHLLFLGGFPICRIMEKKILDRYNINHNVPLFEPYVPRRNSLFYSCTPIECKPFRLNSMSQLSHPMSNLKHCYLETPTPSKYVCESVKYLHYKNIDKLLFLGNNIPTKKFYLADCLLYSDGERICHRKKDNSSHAKLIYTGIIAKPNEINILSQNELICEETDTKRVYCEYNLYVPYSNGLKQRQPVKMADRILLKTGSTLVPLKLECTKNGCGYHSEDIFSRRNFMSRYDPPGGSVYRCYFAKKQQICKKLYGPIRHVYNERDWLSS